MQRLIGGFGIAAVLLTLPLGLSAQPRLLWETGVPEITAFAQYIMVPSETGERVPEPTQVVYRVAPLHGHLTTFSLKDAQLYAVYLSDAAQYRTLVNMLDAFGSPAAWKAVQDHRLSAFLDGPAACEWVELKPNGAFTIVADDARQPGKDYVVLVNGAAEILGSRPLWRAADDLAAAY